MAAKILENMDLLYQGETHIREQSIAAIEADPLLLDQQLNDDERAVRDAAAASKWTTSSPTGWYQGSARTRYCAALSAAVAEKAAGMFIAPSPAQSCGR